MVYDLLTKFYQESGGINPSQQEKLEWLEATLEILLGSMTRMKHLIDRFHHGTTINELKAAIGKAFYLILATLFKGLFCDTSSDREQHKLPAGADILVGT